ncbi:ABC transporter permease subunit [Beduinella massiliensis]|uniref:ABC transporter permease subunit n=1 Tax=Beduinella massiliensis TaxID=1852363 RepID=UPI000C83B8A4
MAGTVTKGEKTFLVVNDVVMVVLCAIMIYPILFVLGRSVTPEFERALNPLRLIPRTFDWSGYRFILSSGSNIINSYLTTIARTLIGTTLNIVVTTLLAYPLSKKYYPPRRALTGMIVFTMWFSGGLIPSFLLNKSLGLINNFWVYILPSMVNAFNLIIMRNFFMQIPDSLEESAKLDGANDLHIFFRIYLPLSTASIATITLFYAVYHWNMWFDSMLYMNRKEMWTMQYTLRQLIDSATVADIATVGSAMDNIPPAETVRMSTIVIATVPILCVYPFLQKYFVKGMLVGSVKG